MQDWTSRRLWERWELKSRWGWAFERRHDGKNGKGMWGRIAISRDFIEFQAGGTKWQNDKRTTEWRVIVPRSRRECRIWRKAGMPTVGKTKGSIAKWMKTKARALKRKWNKHMQAKWGDLLNSRGIILHRKMDPRGINGTDMEGICRDWKDNSWHQYQLNAFPLSPY